MQASKGNPMDNSTVTTDFLNRCIDNAAWIGVGIFGLWYYPRKIRRQVQSGRMSAARGKKSWMIVTGISYVAITIGVLRIFRVLR
jgi:hypothetical protein